MAEQEVEIKVGPILGPIFKWMRKANAIVLEYQDYDGSISEKQRNKLRYCMVAIGALSLIQLHSYIKGVQIVESKDEIKMKRHFRHHRIIANCIMAACGLTLYTGYQIYSMMPKERLEQKQKAHWGAFIAMLKRRKAKEIEREEENKRRLL